MTNNVSNSFIKNRIEKLDLEVINKENSLRLLMDNETAIEELVKDPIISQLKAEIDKLKGEVMGLHNEMRVVNKANK